MSESALQGNWNYPTPIRFGNGRIAELAETCRELGMNNPLLITDPGLAKLPMVETSVDSCRQSGLDCGLFTQVQANPVEENVTLGVEAFNQGGHDGVIAFGGGSALDAAKAVALMVGQNRPLWDFEDREDWYKRVNVEAMAPVVAVPTTSGTGSEVGRSSVITDLRDHTKKIIFHPNMLPARVICDPGLTVGLPGNITAWVGMDALSHNMEAFFSPSYHPMAQGIALEGMRLVKEHLPTAVDDGSNFTARSHMMIASTMGATAFQKGLGAMHSLSHPCGAVLNMQHGLTNAIVMPYVLAFNRTAIEQKATDIARYLELPNPCFDSLLSWVLELRSQVGIPHTLAEIGITEQQLLPLAPMAVADPTAGGNPRSFSEADATAMYRAALSGVIEH